jgi:hypothetical protein
MYGGDLSTLDLPDPGSCLSTCQSDSRCRAFSYDKWNKKCFLKDRVTVINLEPNSVSGTKDGTQAKRSNAEITIQRRRTKGVIGKMLSEKTALSINTCQRFCTEDTGCVAFSFALSRRQCQLYTSIDDIEPRQGVESGYKRQHP